MMGGFGGGMVLWVILLGVVVWALVSAGVRTAGPANSARQILDVRFARGELSSDEYRRLRAELD